MLKIQVLGKGLIPRGLGLAPRKTPFNADYTLISTLLNTPGLSLTYKNPEDGRLIPLTRQNVKRVWDKYSNWDGQKHEVPTGNPSQPHVPGDENTNENDLREGKPEEKNEESIPGTVPPEEAHKPEEAPKDEKKGEEYVNPASVGFGGSIDTESEEPSEKSEETPSEVTSEKTADDSEKKEEVSDSAIPVVTSGANTNNGVKVTTPAPIPTVLNNGQRNNQKNNHKR